MPAFCLDARKRIGQGVPVDQAEFAGMPAAGVSRKPRKGSLAWYGAEAARYTELSAQHQGLTPPSVAAFILGVSRQRVHELMLQGRFTIYEVCNRKWLPVDEVEQFSTLERPTGRPAASTVSTD